MAREQFNTRLAEDRAEQVHDYADDYSISKSEATRRLITAGLEAELEEEEEPAELKADGGILWAEALARRYTTSTGYWWLFLAVLYLGFRYLPLTPWINATTAVNVGRAFFRIASITAFILLIAGILVTFVLWRYTDIHPTGSEAMGYD